MGTPLGASFEKTSFRVYVRGDTVEEGGSATGFRADAPVPAAAADTGFRQGKAELWMVPGDDAFVFIGQPGEGHAEAWPRERMPLSCQ